jgi:hypothetical protein
VGEGPDSGRTRDTQTVPVRPVTVSYSPNSNLNLANMVLFDKYKFRSGRLVRVFVSDPLLAALRFGWIALIVWGELGVFFYTLFVCRWPKLHNKVRQRSTFVPPLVVDYSSDEGQLVRNRTNTHPSDSRCASPQPTRILSDTFRAVS